MNSEESLKDIHICKVYLTVTDCWQKFAELVRATPSIPGIFVWGR